MSGRFTVRCLFACLGLCWGTAAVQAQFGCSPYPYLGPMVYYPLPVQPLYYWGPPIVAVAATTPARTTATATASVPPAVTTVPRQTPPSIPPAQTTENRPTGVRPPETAPPATVRPTEYALPQVAQPTPAVPTTSDTPKTTAPVVPQAVPRVEIERPRVPPVPPPTDTQTAPVNPLVIPLGPTDTPSPTGRPAVPPLAEPTPPPKLSPMTPTPAPHAGGYTIPSINPKPATEGSPKLPPLKLPTSPLESASFFRPQHAERPLRVDVFPVAGTVATRATVGVFNYTEQEIEFTLAGKHHRLPARHCVCLESGESEIDWQVNRQPHQHTALPVGAHGVEIVIRP
ncbi:MAG: hypothetical protein LC104_11535 [Bacteroidales bacterium]|nr:hypothetical protein [Bacteroidales bacterium]